MTQTINLQFLNSREYLLQKVAMLEGENQSLRDETVRLEELLDEEHSINYDLQDKLYEMERIMNEAEYTEYYAEEVKQELPY